MTLCAPGAGGDCINYADYLHWVGSVRTPDVAMAVATDGFYAYVADSTSGLQVVDISRPGSPTITGCADTPGQALGVAIDGDYAYVGDGASGLQVIDISDASSPTIVGGVNTPFRASGVTASAGLVFVADGFSGLQIVDVSIPQSPVIVGSANTPGDARSVAVYGPHACVVGGDELHSGLQVVDVSNPTAPTNLGYVETPDFPRDVAINGAYAYVADRASGLVVVDISNPQLPVIVGTAETLDVASGIAADGPHAYVSGFARTRGYLDVFDASDPFAPTRIGRISTPGAALDVAIGGTFACVADSVGGLQIADASNPASPNLVGGVDLPGANKVAVDLSRAYVAARGAGLRVVDVSNPASPLEVSFVDTPGGGYDVAVDGFYAYFADRYGLLVIDVSLPWPQIVGEVSMPDIDNAVAVQIDGIAHAYVADGSAGLVVVNVASPTAPWIVTNLVTTGSARDVVVEGAYAYVTTSNPTGLRVIEVTDPAMPRMVGGLDVPPPSLGQGVDVDGGYAYMAANEGTLYVIDVSNPSLPMLVSTIGDPLKFTKDVIVDDGYAYVADFYGVYVFDVSSPSSPFLAGNYVDLCCSMGVDTQGDFVFVARSAGEGNSALQILQKQCPGALSVEPSLVMAVGARLWAAPNPAGSCVCVGYDLGPVPDGRILYKALDFRIVDVQGRVLQTLSGGVGPTGSLVLQWNRRDVMGRRVGAGVYWIELAGERSRKTAKIVLLD